MMITGGALIVVGLVLFQFGGVSDMTADTPSEGRPRVFPAQPDVRDGDRVRGGGRLVLGFGGQGFTRTWPWLLTPAPGRPTPPSTGVVSVVDPASRSEPASATPASGVKSRSPLDPSTARASNGLRSITTPPTAGPLKFDTWKTVCHPGEAPATHPPIHPPAPCGPTPVGCNKFAPSVRDVRVAGASVAAGPDGPLDCVVDPKSFQTAERPSVARSFQEGSS